MERMRGRRFLPSCGGGSASGLKLKMLANSSVRLYSAPVMISIFPLANLYCRVNERGQAFTARNFSQWFRRECERVGLKGLSAHGLRKAACRRLAEAGCSANEIAAISGHASLAEVARYTRRADQAKLARNAMAKTAAR